MFCKGSCHPDKMEFLLLTSLPPFRLFVSFVWSGVIHVLQQQRPLPARSENLFYDYSSSFEFAITARAIKTAKNGLPHNNSWHPRWEPPGGIGLQARTPTRLDGAAQFRGVVFHHCALQSTYITYITLPRCIWSTDWQMHWRAWSPVLRRCLGMYSTYLYTYGTYST